MDVQLPEGQRPIIFAPDYRSATLIAQRVYGVTSVRDWVFGNDAFLNGRTPDEYVIAIYNPSIDFSLDERGYEALDSLRNRWDGLWHIHYVSESDL